MAFVIAIPDNHDVPLASIASGSCSLIGESESFGESGVVAVIGGMMLLVLDFRKEIFLFC